MTRNLYLASQSPRRLELLRQVGLSPTVLPLRVTIGRADVDETPYPDEPGADYVLRLAHTKAESAARVLNARDLPSWPILAADTTVTLDGQIMGKPRDEAEARVMLKGCSGRMHRVFTGVAVAHSGHIQTALSESQVTFRLLSDEEISAYIASGEPFDKAGGYGIQGRAAIFIEHLTGSYSGVMGLPLFETAELLKSAGFACL